MSKARTVVDAWDYRDVAAIEAERERIQREGRRAQKWETFWMWVCIVTVPFGVMAAMGMLYMIAG